MRFRQPWIAVILPIVLIGCSSKSASTPTTASTAGATTTAPVVIVPTTAAPQPETRYSTAGSYDVGVRSFTLASGAPVEIWFPIRKGTGTLLASYSLRSFLPAGDQSKIPDADAGTVTEKAFVDGTPMDPTGAKFPLVVFSHGLAGYRNQSTFLTTHLASWGFVVISVEHRSRDLAAILSGATTKYPTDVADMTEALSTITDENQFDGLGKIVDLTKVAAVGHSAGGGAAVAFAESPLVTTFVALAAPAQPTGAAVGKPGMYIAGSDDAIAQEARIRDAYTKNAGPKRLAVLAGVSHLGFMDVCTLGGSKGDVLATAVADGVKVAPLVVSLFAQGCDAKHTFAIDAWPVINQLVTAQLRSVFGIDPSPVGLTPNLATAYPKVKVTYLEDLSAA